MAWPRPGYKPLSEPRMESLLTHICVTRPQWECSSLSFMTNAVNYRRCFNGEQSYEMKTNVCAYWKQISTSRIKEEGLPMRKKLSPWAHRELTVVTAPGPMITAQSQLGEVTAQWRLGHSSVTAQSQLNHGIFSMITARSQLNHGPGHGSLSHGWLWPFWSQCAHGELTVSSHGGQFFSHGYISFPIQT